jgi:hypothetical protein
MPVLSASLTRYYRLNGRGMGSSPPGAPQARDDLAPMWEGPPHPLRATPQLEFEAALMIVEVDTTFDDDTTEERVFAENLRAAGVDPGPSS